MGETIRALAIALLVSATGFAAAPVQIRTAHETSRELQTKAELASILSEYDLSKYTFTDQVVIEEGAMNHAFPVLTLNCRFLGSDDELLSSFIHEQLHWYLRAHLPQTRDGIRQLRGYYPHVPVGLPEGADTEYSTYGHLIDCYLEMQADRQLMGEKRTKAVIEHKPHYLWIYKTIVKDEPRIGSLVEEEHLEIR
ncbi:MAG: hypothetical protein ABSB82_04100 [Terriglobia bacterium]|jgi:hypothetical protein